MNLDMENPATLAADRAPNSSLCVVAGECSEHNRATPKIQELRAAFVARKARLSHDIAHLIAALLFGGARDDR
jgi:hypothetical protein